MSQQLTVTDTRPVRLRPIKFAWLELTGKCQLKCTHCFADSGPQGSHGLMQLADWQRVITELAQFGVEMVQFIGGEPTLHPHFQTLVRFALGLGLEVEVFSNLARRITPELWEVFSLPGVSLATSYYSDDHTQHDAITQVRGSGQKTLASLAEALERGIPVRVGIIGVTVQQRVIKASDALRSIGIAEDRIRLTVLREVGRGVRENGTSVDELCGRCTQGVIAVSPSGEVWPCVFARWLPVGNVLESPVQTILTGERFASTTATLQRAFAKRQLHAAACPPNNGHDEPCPPDCIPSTGCQPSAGTCAPTPGDCL